MAKRRKEKRFYKYSCILTGDTFKLTEKIDNVEELVSVEAFYQMNPEKDDRPLVVKKRLGVDEESLEALALEEKEEAELEE